MVPKEVLMGIFTTLRQQMQMTSLPELQMSWRIADGFFNIRIGGNASFHTLIEKNNLPRVVFRGLGHFSIACKLKAKRQRCGTYAFYMIQ